MRRKLRHQGQMSAQDEWAMGSRVEIQTQLADFPVWALAGHLPWTSPKPHLTLIVLQHNPRLAHEALFSHPAYHQYGQTCLYLDPLKYPGGYKHHI